MGCESLLVVVVLVWPTLSLCLSWLEADKLGVDECCVLMGRREEERKKENNPGCFPSALETRLTVEANMCDTCNVDMRSRRMKQSGRALGALWYKPQTSLGRQNRSFYIVIALTTALTLAFVLNHG